MDSVFNWSAEKEQRPENQNEPENEADILCQTYEL